MCSALGNKSSLCADWIEHDFEEIDKQYLSGMSLSRNRIIDAWVDRFSTMEKYNFFTQYFIDHPFPTSKNAIKQALERMLKKITFVEREEKTILSFIEQL